MGSAKENDTLGGREDTGKTRLGVLFTDRKIECLSRLPIMRFSIGGRGTNNAHP